MIHARWEPCSNICRHWDTAESPIFPAIRTWIIHRGRVAAFRAFAKRRKLESINIEFTDFVAEQAAMLTLEMLHSPKPPTAFIYETEILAAASLHAMAEDYSARQMEAGGGPCGSLSEWAARHCQF